MTDQRAFTWKDGCLTSVVSGQAEGANASSVSNPYKERAEADETELCTPSRAWADAGNKYGPY